MLDNKNTIKDSDLEKVSGGANNILKEDENFGTKEVQDNNWKCPKCGGNKYKITLFEDEGRKIECSNCQYSVYN